MQTRSRNSALLAAALAAGALATPAMAEVNLMFGDPAAMHVSITLSPDKASDTALVVKTRLAGVAGSRVSFSIDRVGNNLFDHLLTTEECKFVDQASECQFSIAGGTPEYDRIVLAFKKGLTLHVEVENAGSMEMSDDISLRGFTKSYNAL